MLSGIGTKDHLSSLGIPVIADIPAIGSNLYDHVFAIIQLEVTPDVLTVYQWSTNTTEEATAKAQYTANRSGPLGWNNGFTYAAFRLPDSVWDSINGSHYIDSPPDRPHVLMEYTTIGFIPQPNLSTISAWASLIQPEASGHVALNSSSYRDDPLIYTNYYGSEADKAAMIYTYKKPRADVLGAEGKALTVKELYPGANVTSDEEIWAVIQKGSYSFRHPVGTVAIRKALGRDWRVNGLKGIRVVDLSTFPTPSSCHPQADVYALAHRAARDIRRDDAKGEGGRGYRR